MTFAFFYGNWFLSLPEKVNWCWLHCLKLSFQDRWFFGNPPNKYTVNQFSFKNILTCIACVFSACCIKSWFKEIFMILLCPMLAQLHYDHIWDKLVLIIYLSITHVLMSIPHSPQHTQIILKENKEIKKLNINSKKKFKCQPNFIVYWYFHYS